MDKRRTFWNICYKAGITDLEKCIGDMYIAGMSSKEIQEHFANKYRAVCTEKNISDYVKRSGVPIRSKQEAKINAIKRGRMVYLKKPKHLLKKSGSLSSKIRFNVLERDNFACTLCGNSPKTGYTLEIHHINGSSSDLDNLQTLCFQCHRGLHYTKKDKV